MHIRGRRLRFTAVSAMVVLALTGFSSGRSQGDASRDSSDTGGCSSSVQDHDGSTPGGGSHGNDQQDSPSSGSPGSDASNSGTSTGDSGGSSHSTPTAPSTSGTPRPLKDGTAVLVRCASMEDPYATVEIRNPNGRDGLFNLKVNFRDKYGRAVVDTGNQVWVPAKDRTTYRVPVASSGRLDVIDQCVVNPRAAAVR
ncbi:hypothetical protein ACFVGN_01590 [Streptomyces sp. NPDC057757]|uniref:hypothetical protein n=1 Tax=Streptomyces sp. NPDC057757 TaxID=3346241 RepID=UPI00367DB27D